MSWLAQGVENGRMLPALKSVMDKIETLDPFPAAAVRVLELSMAGDPDPIEIGLVIKLDPGMTAKVLKLANSAAKGTLVEISSIEQAAVKLGSSELARMALTSGAHSFYSGLGSSTPRSSKSLWEESLTNAIASRLVAQDRDHDRPDLHYTVGLLMNIGHVVLDRFLRSSRDDVLARMDMGAKALRAEHDVLGATHAEIGGRLAREWNFPEALTDAIEYHHTPLAAADPDLGAHVNLAEALTWESMRPVGVKALSYGVSGATVKHTGIGKADVDSIRAALPAAIASQRYLLGLD